MKLRICFLYFLSTCKHIFIYFWNFNGLLNLKVRESLLSIIQNTEEKINGVLKIKILESIAKTIPLVWVPALLDWSGTSGEIMSAVDWGRLGLVIETWQKCWKIRVPFSRELRTCWSVTRMMLTDWKNPTY